MIEFPPPFITDILRECVNQKPAEPAFGQIRHVPANIRGIRAWRMAFLHCTSFVYYNQFQKVITYTPPDLDQRHATRACQRMLDHIIESFCKDELNSACFVFAKFQWRQTCHRLCYSLAHGVFGTN